MFPLPEDDPDSPLPLTVGFAVLLALGAGYLHFALRLGAELLTASPGSTFVSYARIGITAILAYGGALALAAPRLREAPSQALGFLPVPGIGWLAAALMLPSILLISEIDNVMKALLLVAGPASVEPKPVIDAMRIAEWGLVTVAVLPVVEEVFFRGLLQPRLVETWGRVRGILSGALIASFALSLGTFSLWVLPLIAARSLLFGVLRESTGSVLPGLGVHVAFGVVTLLSMFGTFGIPGFDDATAAHTPLTLLLPAAATTGLALGLCRVLMRASDSLRADDPAD